MALSQGRPHATLHQDVTASLREAADALLKRWRGAGVQSTNPESDMCKQPSGQLCQSSPDADPSQALGEHAGCKILLTGCCAFLRAAAGPQWTAVGH